MNQYKTQIETLLDEGWLMVNKHPEADLWIYNYTAKTQYEHHWNWLTLMCRGLILDADWNIVARPFPKFFNLGEFENQPIPNLPFEVYDKLDGSLGILYWWDGKPFIASRGSFSGEQAVKATELLHRQYAHLLSSLNREVTYLFEIIYPENRIVVDYGKTEALVLLAMIETQSGNELPLEDIGFPMAKRFDGIKDIQALKAMENDEQEGFVIRFSNNYRLKLKFGEYLRLHRVLTQVSTKTIWEYLKTNQSFDQILERVPDEFFEWVKQTVQNLKNEFEYIENQCKRDFKVLETRKETAAYFQTCSFPKILFLMLDNKPYASEIWKYLKPKYEKPFKKSVE